MPISKIIRNDSSRNLDDYLETEKVGATIPRVMYASAQNCQVGTAEREFRALRKLHGTQGAKRTAAGRYSETEPGDTLPATHIKAGKNWRLARSGETATHTRAEPKTATVKQTESVHVIVSFGLDEVDPTDPEATQRAFEFVVAEWAALHPGLQSKFVAHGDGAGSAEARAAGETGKFHVHISNNATIYKDFALDGRIFKAGQKMAKELTDIEALRQRQDDYLKAHHHEYGLGPQKLPAVGSPEANQIRVTKHDYRGRQSGDLTHSDNVRALIDASVASIDPATLVGRTKAERQSILGTELMTRGVFLKPRTVKTTGEVKIRSYVLGDNVQGVSGNKLGDAYKDEGMQAQLQARSEDRWAAPARSKAGPPKKLEPISDAEFDELQAAVYAQLPGTKPVAAPVAPATVATSVAPIESDEGTSAPIEPTATRTAPTAPVAPPTAPAAPPAALPRKKVRLGLLSDADRNGVELLAVVRSERTDGGAYVEFMMSSRDRRARRQRGLNLVLRQRKTVSHTTGELTTRESLSQQLTRAQYDALKAAGATNQAPAGDNKVMYAVRADLLAHNDGYAVDATGCVPSELPQINAMEEMLEQRAFEDRAREQQNTQAMDDDTSSRGEREEGLGF